MSKKAKPNSKALSFLDSLDDDPAPVSKPSRRKNASKPASVDNNNPPAVKSKPGSADPTPDVKQSSKEVWLAEQKAKIEEPPKFTTTPKGTTIIPFVPLPQRSPPKTPPGTFSRGDIVFYREERYFIEYAPSDWSQGHYARISSAIVHPDPDRLPAKDRITMCVHVDLLRVAPRPRNIHGKLPTVASVARAERAAAGHRDVGDKTAELLRGATDAAALYRIGAEALGCKPEELAAKYGHLNPGQQRMNIGNRMRAKFKKEYKHEHAA